MNRCNGRGSRVRISLLARQADPDPSPNHPSRFPTFPPVFPFSSSVGEEEPRRLPLLPLTLEINLVLELALVTLSSRSPVAPVVAEDDLRRPCPC